MSESNNKDVQQINILPSDSHGDILVQLIRGQERAATALELQNRRLFGGDGQAGSIPALFDLQQKLAAKLDDNKEYLVTKIDGAKRDLQVSINGNKAETDGKIEKVSDAQIDLDRKVNRFTTVAATVNTIFIGAMAALGFYHKSH
jgi:hypothetical protein